MQLGESAKVKANELYYKAESIWYDGTSMERDDMLFFYPVTAFDFAWWDAGAREEAMSDMDYVIGCAHDTVLDTVAEWSCQAEADGLAGWVVNELVAEYLPQMLARESALCEYRGQMIDVLAEAARYEWDR